MSYIGATPTSTAFLTDSFSGDGSTTSFTLSAAPASSSSILVAVSGVLQDPATYAVVGTTLNFTGAPPSGTANISVRYLGIPASNISTAAYRTVTEFTATAGQTSFSTPSYTVGFINVYRNGVLLGSADYTATTGTTVVLASGATAGDLITTESFYVSSIYNAISNTAGSVNANNIADGAVGTAEIADGAVTPAKLSTGGPYWNSSSQLLVGTSTAPSGGIMSSCFYGATAGGVQVAYGSSGGGAITPASGAGLRFYTYTGAVGSESYTTAMTIDSSGRVTMPYQPVVVLQTNSAQSVGGGATFKPTNIRMNVGSNYNGTTGQFTCPVAGVYRVWWAGNYYVSGTFAYSCVIRKNSVNTAWSYDHANSSGDWVGGAYEYILSCAAGDTLDIYSSQTWVCDGSTYWSMGFQLIG